jgi:hypothetical protein
MPTAPLSRQLLDRLADEEALLRAAVASAAELHTALRKGDRTHLAAVQAIQENLAARMNSAALARHRAATELAAGLHRPAGSPPKLASLAEALPEPEAADLLAARDRLATVAGELARWNGRNANLVAHLRSYFRGVLASLTAAGADRYGPAGTLVGPAGGALQARG